MSAVRDAASHLPPESEAALETVVSGAAFAKAPVLRKLLVYLWGHRHESITEYAIGVDVFGKREDFDPRTDATVRVQISRLRQKLKEHFEAAGADADYRLVIPPGGHRLELIAAPKPTTSAPTAPPPGLSLLLPAFRKWLPWMAVGILAVIAAVFGWQNRLLRTQVEASRQQSQLPPLWQTILRPGRVTRLIYPVPVFYVWDRLRVRDVLVNDPEGWRQSPHLAPFIQRFGKPQVSQSYSVASDTSAIIQITRFLSGRGVPLEVSPTASLSLDQYGNENLMFLGIPPTNAALDGYVNKTNFYLLPGNGSVGNRNPLPGEPERFYGSSDPESPSLVRRHGIIAVMPGHSPGSSLTLLMGLQTSGLAAFLTSPLSLEEFQHDWDKAGRPPFFEAVVEATLDGTAVKKVKRSAFRAIQPKP
jgi:hypothetical protein